MDIMGPGWSGICNIPNIVNNKPAIIIINYWKAAPAGGSACWKIQSFPGWGPAGHCFFCYLLVHGNFHGSQYLCALLLCIENANKLLVCRGPLHRFSKILSRALCRSRRSSNWRINHFTLLGRANRANRSSQSPARLASDTFVSGRCLPRDAFNKPKPRLNCRPRHRDHPPFFFKNQKWKNEINKKWRKKKARRRKSRPETVFRLVSFIFGFLALWLLGFFYFVAFIDFSIWNHSISLLILTFWLPSVSTVNCTGSGVWWSIHRAKWQVTLGEYLIKIVSQT